MSGHTPGPWIYWGEGIYPAKDFGEGVEILVALCPVVLRDVDDGHWYGSLIDPKAEDMTLIAAAPELLEALEMVRDADDDCIADGLPRIPSIARSRIDAVIAKATGESE